MFAILLHIAIGIIAILEPSLMLFYLISVFIYFCWQIISKKKKALYVLLACAYFTGAEVFFRMTKTFTFYETGKYAVIFFSLLGIVYLGFKKNAFIYSLYLLLLVPGIFVSYDAISYGENFRTAVFFNLSGPICLGIVSVFCYGRTLLINDFLKILDYIVYPLLSMTVYIIFYAPDVQEVITGTASNSAVSGCFGPNQVATVLGLGIFILLSRFLLPYKNKLVHLVMMFLLSVIAYRALITFSRGGVIVSIIISIIFIFIFYFSNNLRTKAKLSLKMIGIIGIAIGVWSFSVFQTGGLIENRYANEDALGREKEDITTGRTKLISAEIDAFKTNPILGVGVGQVKIYFEEELGSELPTHNEISRLLSEHGVFGIFALLILISVPFITKLNGRKNIYFYPFLFFWGLTIAHSSIRIAAPAFIYALCLLNIDYETKKKPALHR